MLQWINAVKETLLKGIRRGDRTGTGTMSRFGVVSRFNLREGFPLVTSKFTSFHAIKHELLWMLGGNTNVAYLKMFRVSIWDEWVNPETAHVRALTTKEMAAKLKGWKEWDSQNSSISLVSLFTQVTGKLPLFVSTPLESFDDTSRIQVVVPRPAPDEPEINVTLFQISGMIDHLIGRGVDLDTICTQGELFGYDHELPWKQKIQKLCHERYGSPFVWPVDIVDGELGPVYGKQMVRWQPGIDPEKLQRIVKDLPASRYDEIPLIIKELTPEPINQIQYVIDLLKNDPESRRIYLSMWNVGELKEMALMPCHISCQFYSEENITKSVSGKRLLSVMVYMRSNDAGLGEPFNIAQYALLLSMVAHVTNHDVNELIMVRGDHHVYLNHVEALEEVIQTRQPMALPTLWLNPDITDIFDFTGTDICVEGYESHPAVKLPVAI